jgi:hypothetical protein
MRLRIIALACVFTMIGNLAWAQQYTQLSTSVTSSSVPINVLPAGLKKAWCIRPRSTAANPVLCFAYNGTIPGSPPTNTQELSAGFQQCDNLYPVGDTAVSEPWACVLSTGVTAVTVDATYR